MPKHGKAQRKKTRARQPVAKAATWPAWITRLDPATNGFTLALSFSLLVHALLLSVHFSFPNAFRRSAETQLDVVLVNAKHKRKPVDAQAKAQANLDGGGNTDENRIAKTPLPASEQVRPGDALMETQRRVQALETQQQKLLALAKSKVTTQAAPSKAEPQPDQPTNGADLAQNALAIARMEAQIDRDVEEYNRRPRKIFIGARTEEAVDAQYLEDWRTKVERIGNLNYPEEAKGKLYGSLQLYVEIGKDGKLESVEVRRSSGYKILDQAAVRVVRMAAPYASFPAALKAKTDVIGFARTWVFTKSDQIRSE